jgi:hypothetical protein
MMDLYERLLFFLVGCGVGVILGYVVGRLHVVEKRVHEVEDILNEERDDRGSARIPSFSSLMLVIVLTITAIGAFMAQRSANQVEHTVTCLTEFNVDQLRALSARDAAIQNATQEEIYLWTVYDELYEIAKKDPSQIGAIQERLRVRIINYRDELLEAQRARTKFDYGNPNILKDCHN